MLTVEQLLGRVQKQTYWPESASGQYPDGRELRVDNFNTELLKFESTNEPYKETLHGRQLSRYTELVTDPDNVNAFPWPLFGIPELLELQKEGDLYELGTEKPTLEYHGLVLNKLKTLARSPKYNLYILKGDYHVALPGSENESLESVGKNVVGCASIIDVPAGEYETWLEKVVLESSIKGRHVGRAFVAQVTDNVLNSEAKLDGRKRRNIHLATIVDHNRCFDIHYTLQNPDVDIFNQLYWNLDTLTDAQIKAALNSRDILVERADRIFKALGDNKEYLSPMEIIALRLGFHHLQTTKDHAEISETSEFSMSPKDRPNVALPTRRYSVNHRIWNNLHPDAVRQAVMAT